MFSLKNNSLKRYFIISKLKLMDKSICIILIVNSNFELFKKTLFQLQEINDINELNIICNSKSKNDIQDLINKSKSTNFKKIEIKSSLNIVETINLFFSQANSSYGLVLNEGDYLDHEVLSNLINIFTKDLSTKIIYTNTIFTNQSGTFLSYYPADNLEKFFHTNSYLKPIVNSSVLLRTEIFKEIGCFDIKFKYHFMFEYINRCLKYNKEHFYTNKYVRYDSNFLSHKKINSFSEIDGLNNYKKAIEFLDICNQINNTNTNYIEKKFLQLIHKKNYKKVFQEVDSSQISIDTKEKIQLLFRKIEDNKKDIQNYEIESGKPQQLQIILNTRPDLKNHYFHLEKFERQFCCWLLNHGFTEYPNLLNYSDSKETIDWLKSKNDKDYISRINRAIWDSNRIFQTIFRTKKSIKFFNFLINLFWIFLPLKLPKFNKEYNFSIQRFFKLKGKSLKISSQGVNLIGYARHALGIGEDLRSTVYALNSMKLNTAIINFQPGLDKSREENTLENRIQKAHLYKTTIICMTAEETIRYVMNEGITNLKDRYIIGYWPWELPNWPKSWIWAFDFVNEIWVSSNHIKESVVKETDKPVKVMPLCVDQEGYKIFQQTHEERIINRKSFNLNLDAIYICYSFDQNSYIDRKNPLDAIRAFQMAFPPYPLNKVNNNVKLIIKTYPHKNISWEWQFLKEISKYDRRVEIIEKNMSRVELLSFYGCCDIFLSLHRAEGYGRCLAEALQLGLDLIATDWSGNKDFCKGDLYYPVPYKLIPLKPLEYPYWQGQFWAEPDIYSAAKILEKVVHKRMKKGLPNKDISLNYQRYFSAIQCGKRYKKRLEDLGLINLN